MIVDDQQSMRGICKYILTQLGFKDIIEAKSGRDALGKLEKSNVHLIISDWNMEDIDGLTLLRVIRMGRRSPMLTGLGEARRRRPREKIPAKYPSSSFG